jgi:hypothetical protein
VVKELAELLMVTPLAVMEILAGLSDPPPVLAALTALTLPTPAGMVTTTFGSSVMWMGVAAVL